MTRGRPRKAPGEHTNERDVVAIYDRECTGLWEKVSAEVTGSTASTRTVRNRTDVVLTLCEMRHRQEHNSRNEVGRTSDTHKRQHTEVTEIVRSHDEVDEARPTHARLCLTPRYLTGR